MLGTRWLKVFRDLWHNKTRTLLVVLSIAVGVFAVGVIAGSRITLSRELAASYAASNPSHATIFTLNTFDENLVKSVQAMPVIETAEARGSVYTRLQIGSDEWLTLQLVAVPDFENIGLDKVRSQSGDWPPLNHELLIERSSIGMVNAGEGATLIVKAPNGKERPMHISGVAHDLFAKVFALDGVATGYITFDTLEWLGEPRDFRELRFRLADGGDDVVAIRQVADEVQDKVERSGGSVLITMIPNPGQHPLDYAIQAMSLILGVMGLFALFLSSFLVINTVAALLAQQQRQIGTMKAIGARTNQILGMYMVTVTLYGLLALLVALPLGAVGAHAFTVVMAEFFNFDVSSFQIPVAVIILETAVAILVPIIAGFFPVLAGARVTVQEAINDYGLDKNHYGASIIDRWLTQIQILSRPFLLSLRNTFRRKLRLALTLITLTLAGTIFIATFSVYTSFLGSLHRFMDYYQYDVAVQFNRPYRIQQLQRETAQIPGIVAAEGWAFANTRMVYEDGSHSGMVILFAPPAETKMINPSIGQGRWLQPGDKNAIVVNTITLRDEPEKGVGDEITLKLEGEKTTWEIVGIAEGGQFVPMAFIDSSAYTRAIGSVDQADWLMVKTEQHTEAYQRKVLSLLERQLEAHGFRIGATSIIAQELNEVQAIFQGILTLLIMMTILMAAVGGLGLMGTMSINVLERTREIGVMRAIGASNRTILSIIIQEGILIGLVSWLFSILLAFPLSLAISNAVGQQFLNAPLNYKFSWQGTLTWLITVVLIAAFASYWPARQAAKLTVHEILAYE